MNKVSTALKCSSSRSLPSPAGEPPALLSPERGRAPPPRGARFRCITRASGAGHISTPPDRSGVGDPSRQVQKRVPCTFHLGCDTAPPDAGGVTQGAGGGRSARSVPSSRIPCVVSITAGGSGRPGQRSPGAHTENQGPEVITDLDSRVPRRPSLCRGVSGRG